VLDGRNQMGWSSRLSFDFRGVGRFVVPSFLTRKFTTGWRRMISFKSIFLRSRETIFKTNPELVSPGPAAAEISARCPRIVTP